MRPNHTFLPQAESHLKLDSSLIDVSKVVSLLLGELGYLETMPPVTLIMSLVSDLVVKFDHS